MGPGRRRRSEEEAASSEAVGAGALGSPARRGGALRAKDTQASLALGLGASGPSRPGRPGPPCASSRDPTTRRPSGGGARPVPQSPTGPERGGKRPAPARSAAAAAASPDLIQALRQGPALGVRPARPHLDGGEGGRRREEGGGRRRRTWGEGQTGGARGRRYLLLLLRYPNDLFQDLLLLHKEDLLTLDPWGWSGPSPRGKDHRHFHPRTVRDPRPPPARPRRLPRALFTDYARVSRAGPPSGAASQGRGRRQGPPLPARTEGLATGAPSPPAGEVRSGRVPRPPTRSSVDRADSRARSGGGTSPTRP